MDDIKNKIIIILSEGKIENLQYDFDSLINFITSKRLIVLDTEATGISPSKKHSLITELAASVIDGQTGKELDFFHQKTKLTKEVFDRMENEARFEKRKKLVTNWDRNKIYKKWDIVRYHNAMWYLKIFQTQQRPDEEPNVWKKLDPRFKTVEEILKMTDYYNDVVKYKEIDNMLENFVEWINKNSNDNTMIVAHNARFDMHSINYAIEKFLDKSKKIKLPVIDTLAIAQRYFRPLIHTLYKKHYPIASEIYGIFNEQAWKKRLKVSLGALGKIFKVKTEHWHTAKDDVEQLSGILQSLLQFLKDYKHIETSIEYKQAQRKSIGKRLKRQKYDRKH